MIKFDQGNDSLILDHRAFLFLRMIISHVIKDKGSAWVRECHNPN